MQRLAVILKQQELEQHKALAPKASQLEGFLTQSLTMLTSKKKMFGNTIKAVPAVVFQGS